MLPNFTFTSSPKNTVDPIPTVAPVPIITSSLNVEIPVTDNNPTVVTPDRTWIPLPNVAIPTKVDIPVTSKLVTCKSLNVAIPTKLEIPDTCNCSVTVRIPTFKKLNSSLSTPITVSA